MFEIRQCTHTACGLRFPMDPDLFRGAYCPRCGSEMFRVGEPFLTPQDVVVVQPKRKINILLDNIRSAHNVGAIFRTADGVGAKHIYLCGITPNPRENPAVQKTALGAEDALTWSDHLNTVALSKELRSQNHFIIALETTTQSIPIFHLETEALGETPILLIVGNEQAGVDPGLLALCDLILSLPMAGSKASLNVAVAFGVAAYWLAFV